MEINEAVRQYISRYGNDGGQQKSNLQLENEIDWMFGLVGPESLDN